MRHCLILLGLLLPVLVRGADFTFTPELQQAYADILKLKVRNGQQALAPELARGNGIAVYLANYADMVTLLVSDDRQAYQRLARREDERLTFLKAQDEASPWQRLTQAEVRLHWAFVKLKFGQELSACWDIIRAYRLLDENRKRFPNFRPTYKSLGVLHVLIGSVPENYTWVTRMLGLRGDVQAGLREIQTVAQQEPLFQTEARLIDLLIRAYVLRFTPGDVARLKELVAEGPDNLLLHFFGSTMLMKDGRSEEALAYLERRPAGPDYLAFPILEYLKGEIYLQKADYPAAEQHYRLFLSRYKGLNFVKDTYYKLFLADWLSGREAEAVASLKQVAQVGEEVVEADKAAANFAKLYFKKGVSDHQKILMRARLATDGGFLDGALAFLQPYTEQRFTLPAEKAEFNYRKGRILQKRGELTAAVPYFERAIALSEGQTFSFGATAALQLGYVYRQLGQPAKARQAFQKALSYPKHEYKSSVDNKAKAALNEGA